MGFLTQAQLGEGCFNNRLHSSTGSKTTVFQNEKWWCRRVIDSLFSVPGPFLLLARHPQARFIHQGQQGMAFSDGLPQHAQCNGCQSLHTFSVTKKENKVQSWIETTRCKYFDLHHFVQRKVCQNKQVQKCKWIENWMSVNSIFFFSWRVLSYYGLGIFVVGSGAFFACLFIFLFFSET